MWNPLRATWTWLNNLIKCSPPASPSQNQTFFRDKAIAVAGRVLTMDHRSSCPVCSVEMQREGDADVRMTMAVHLSLWHADYVLLKWDDMQNEPPRSIVRLPSLIAVVGVAAAFGALLAISARNHNQGLSIKARG